MKPKIQREKYNIPNSSNKWIEKTINTTILNRHIGNITYGMKILANLVLVFIKH